LSTFLTFHAIAHMHRVPDRATEPQRHQGIPQRLARATKVVVYGTFCTLETLGAGRAGHERDDGRCEVKAGPLGSRSRSPSWVCWSVRRCVAVLMGPH
jgi:hypothetical protein